MATCILTPAQAKVISRKVEFSVHFPMPSLIKSFPSVKFEKRGSNGGVTYIYELTGPTVWLDKIERKYAYGH
jgi:hypothetical protein